MTKLWKIGRNVDFFGKQVRLAMVPRDSQQQTQLYEQLTWNSDEQLLS